MFPSNNHIRRILPAIFLVGFLLILPSCRYLKQKFNLGEYSLKSAIEWAKKDSARVADSLKAIHKGKKVNDRMLPDSMKKVLAEKKVFERTLTDSLISIATPVSAPGDPGGYYFIIAGSFSNHDNALQASMRYSGPLYKITIIKTTGKDGSVKELVSVKTFSDKGEAAAFLKQFQEETKPDAWIYSGK